MKKRSRVSPMPSGNPVSRARAGNRRKAVLAGSAIAATLAVIACNDKGDAIAPQVNDAPQPNGPQFGPQPPQAHFEDAGHGEPDASDAASEASDGSTDSGDASDAGDEGG